MKDNDSNSEKMGLKELWEKQNKKSKTYIAMGGVILVIIVIASAAAVVYDNYLTQNTPVDQKYSNISNSTSPLQELIMPLCGYDLSFRTFKPEYMSLR